MNTCCLVSFRSLNNLTVIHDAVPMQGNDAPEGIGIALSISNVSGISGLKLYADRFAKANDINAKNRGDASIAFDDPLSTNLDKDHRPFRTMYEYNKKGRHYSAIQGMKGSTHNKYVKMANKIADAVHKDFVDAFVR